MFALGVLSMIAVAAAAVIVYGIVKVIKMKTKIQQHSERMDSYESHIESRLRDVYTDINVVESTLRSTLKDVYTDINMVESTLSNELNDVKRKSENYTNSRIDILAGQLTGKSVKKTIMCD